MAREARQDGVTAELSGFAWAPDRFNPRVRATSPMPRAGAPPADVISLAYGMPDPALFPTAGLAAAAQEALGDPARYAVALQYGNVGGNPLLLAELGRKLEGEEGRPVTPGTLRPTAHPGDRARRAGAGGWATCASANAFLGTITTFASGVRTVPVSLDDDGIDVRTGRESAWEAAGTRAFIYTIPTFNNPAGTSMTLERRRALLDIAARHGVPIIEDDAYRDLRFEGEPVPTLHALDRDGLVIRLGTFSKIVAPGVRLGFVLADAAVTERVLAFKAEGSTNGFASMVVGTFMKTGGLAAHIETLRAAYRERRDAMYEALAREMPAGVTWTRTQGGFFLWLTVPARADMGKVNAKAAEERIVALAGTECFPDGRGTHNLRLAFSLQPPEKIAEGIRRLGRAIRAGL
jgi:2-aminoadipate transaminase